MALGLPGHLARDALSHALDRAGQAAALVCLTIAVLVGVVSAVALDRHVAWAASGAVLVMIALLAVLWFAPTVTATVAYLVVGTAVMVGVTMIVMGEDSRFATSNNAVLALPRVAMVLVGGAGSGTAIAVTWAVLGFGLGEAAAFLGCALVGATWSPSIAALFALGLVLTTRVFDGVSRNRGARSDTGLHRASEQARELALRHDDELRATARLHDTALSHLVAIAAAGSGRVDERLRAGIRQDLGLIVGRDWAIDQRPEPSPRGTPTADASDPPGGLATALEAAATAGVTVRIMGDLGALELVTTARAEALDAAVAQCLVNVGRHAGVADAELAIGVGGGELTVAVMDSGAGFEEDEVPADRIGLRTSIRGRIEQVGGGVRLWSTKGVGTTIVLTVPIGAAE
ncbi:ATP-binding protein [Agromyces sp. G08B096]|uniref:ATP-binding protein n=1 Tax=Agromyces sp. G08B096 TaxID=3156399 RepID=A0AAU7W621_9MICO